ncbi:MAG: MotA/TolQ/ExbB proton channel family protein [Thermoguttaceae bacterium]
MGKIGQAIQSVTRSPFLWGGLGAAGFYALVHGGPLRVPFVERYFTNHPVEYIETVMFAIGLAALVIKAFDTVAQRAGLRDSLLGSVEPSQEPAEACDGLLARLDRLPGRRQGEYYVCRVRAALAHVRRHGSTRMLDDELKYLADSDAARLHAGYGLFRVIVWAIPMLGFLGTVIGITMMLGGAAKMADGAGQSSTLDIFHGLALKFDTTALALTFSIVLMFIHFPVERSENTLLEQVDLRVQQELAGCFSPSEETIADDADGQLVALRKMAETLLQATELLAQRQAELWRNSIESAGRQWAELTHTAGGELTAAMSAATAKLAGGAEVLERAVEAAGQVAKLEDALNRNLAALAGAKHFEQTVLSLAAAVNMLSARLAESPTSSIHLEPTRRAAHAA